MVRSAKCTKLNAYSRHEWSKTVANESSSAKKASQKQNKQLQDLISARKLHLIRGEVCLKITFMSSKLLM